MPDQERLVRMLVQLKTKRVCNTLLALAGVQSYSYDEKIFFRNDLNTPGGLPEGAWREMGAKIMEAIDGALDEVVHNLVS